MELETFEPRMLLNTFLNPSFELHKRPSKNTNTLPDSGKTRNTRFNFKTCTYLTPECNIDVRLFINIHMLDFYTIIYIRIIAKNYIGTNNMYTI